MRAILVLALSGVLLAGCQAPKPSTPSGPSGDTGLKKGAEAMSARSRPGEAGTRSTAATPVTESTGKVASVNPALRFVVIDFAYNPAPLVDQRMSVYRQGQKVGEVRISRQARNSIVAADIVAGEAKVGDEVRPE